MSSKGIPSSSCSISRPWMPGEVEQQLLRLDDLRSNTGASQPPSIRIELRISRESDQHSGCAATHRPLQHAPQTTRMIWVAHDDNGSQLPASAPLAQNSTRSLGPLDVVRDPLDRGYAEQSQVTSQDVGLVLVCDSPPRQLAFRRRWRLRQQCHAPGNSLMDEVGRFEHRSLPAVNRDDDYVRRGERIFGHKPPARRPQDRVARRGEQQRCERCHQDCRRQVSTCRRSELHDRPPRRG